MTWWKALRIIAIGLGWMALSATAAEREGVTASQQPMETAVSATTLSSPLQACLPIYGEPEFLLRTNESSSHFYEPIATAGDFNGDGLDDVVITKLSFQTTETYELEILVNDGNGRLQLATPNIFQGDLPTVQHPRQIIVADFNGDHISDIFVADHGYDLDPFPGYQNALVLSAPNGKLKNATGNLPQQYDFTHSACVADVDGDKDIDLYVGNIWGQQQIDPQLLLNDGSGHFTVGTNNLPPSLHLDQNRYTTCEFSDVNQDQLPDLILGHSGQTIENELSSPNSQILLNDGNGTFTLLPNALPPQDFEPSDIAHDIQPIHLNDDAYIDLFIVYEKLPGQSYIQALVNNQDGTFHKETQTRLEPLNRQVWLPRLETWDFDHDGDQDLLASPFDANDPNPILYLNDGSGYFQRQFVNFKLPYLYYTFLDLDGDSGRDIVYATYAPPEDIYAIRDLGCPLFLPYISRR
ncbi:MAG: VCBS repeat-containing protein [Ardenticatenaceae bacterium]|nr:VCBS repeat-containing protein [Ardenticatenaceae bacterium]